MNKEIITLLYDIEDEINQQKSWIEIANLICENEDFYDMKLFLTLDRAGKENESIYGKIECLIEKMQKFLVN